MPWSLVFFSAPLWRFSPKSEWSRPTPVSIRPAEFSGPDKPSLEKVTTSQYRSIGHLVFYPFCMIGIDLHSLVHFNFHHFNHFNHSAPCPTVGSTQQVQPYPTRFAKETPEHPAGASAQIFGDHWDIHHLQTVETVLLMRFMRCFPGPFEQIHAIFVFPSAPCKNSSAVIAFIFSPHGNHGASFDQTNVLKSCSCCKSSIDVEDLQFFPMSSLERAFVAILKYPQDSSSILGDRLQILNFAGRESARCARCARPRVHR